nr:hypothetical protein JKL49_22005 [Phenylobacterium glaciei]
MEVAASLAPRTDYAASALQASLDQANAGMRAGVPLLGPPKLRRVTFQGAQAGEAAPRSGASTALPTGPDGPYYEPDGVAGTTIRLRRAPTVILLQARG